MDVFKIKRGDTSPALRYSLSPADSANRGTLAPSGRSGTLTRG